MKRVTTLKTNNRTFEIVKNEDGFYLAIEDKYIDKNGCLTKKLNGLNMKADKDLNKCLQKTKDQCEIDELIANGKSVEEAIKIVILGQIA